MKASTHVHAHDTHTPRHKNTHDPKANRKLNLTQIPLAATLGLSMSTDMLLLLSTVRKKKRTKQELKFLFLSENCVYISCEDNYLVLTERKIIYI